MSIGAQLPANITTATVKDEDGNDVSEQFNVTVVPTTCTISKRPAKITSLNAAKPYDGTPLKKEEVKFETDGTDCGFINGDENRITTKDFASVTRPTADSVTENNTFEYEAPEDILQNYEIQRVRGTLCIFTTSDSINQLTLNLYVENKLKVYDGSPLVFSKFKDQADDNNTIPVTYTTAGGKTVQYTVSLEMDKITFDGGPVDANVTIDKADPKTDDELLEAANGTITATIPDGAITIRDADGEDVTAYVSYNIVPGKAVIKPLPVTITSGSETRVYNGERLQVTTATCEPKLLEGHTLKCNYTGEITLKGSVPNTFDVVSITDSNNRDVTKNYYVTKETGTLTITDRKGPTDPDVEDRVWEVSVTAKSKTDAFYNGAEQSVSGFDGETTPFTGDFANVKAIPVTTSGGTYYVTGLTAEAKGTNANTTYETTITGTDNLKVWDIDHHDVTAQFRVNVVPGKLTIAKRTVTLSSASLYKVYDGTPLTNEDVRKEGVTVDPKDSDGSVNAEGWLTDLGHGATYKFTGSQRKVGESDNSFEYTPNGATEAVKDNYDIKYQPGKLVVTSPASKYEVTVVAKSDTKVYNGTEQHVSGFESQDESGKITVTCNANGQTYYVTGVTAEAKLTNVGNTNTISDTSSVAVTDADGNNVTEQVKVTVQEGTLTITPAPITLTSNGHEREYTGEALTDPSVNVEGMPKTKHISCTATGTQTEIGESTNTISFNFTDDVATNYTITKNEGVLKVTHRKTGNEYKVSVTANSNTFTYDGTEKAVRGFVGQRPDGSVPVTAVNGKEYYVYGLTFEAKGTLVSDSKPSAAPTYTAYEIKDAQGNVLTASFDLAINPGSLVIDPRPVTLTAGSATKAYDGTPLTSGTINESGLVDGHKVSGTTSGSRTLAGDSDNVITSYQILDKNGGDVTSNYKPTLAKGTLTVTNRAQTTDPDNPDSGFNITLPTTNASLVYDGDPHSVNEERTMNITANGNPYTVTYTLTSESITDAGETPITVGNIKVLDGDGQNVAAQFTIRKTDGALTITPRPITLTSNSASKTYDGSALTNDTVRVTSGSWAEGENATYTVTGRQTNIGSSDNAFTLTFNEGTKKENYTITLVYGTLTVRSAGSPPTQEEEEEEEEPRRPVIINNGGGGGTGDTGNNGSNTLTDINDLQTPLADMGLNTTDHYAYLAGFSDGTIRPLANITRAEVATIFFRLMSDNYRTASWATTNSFPDVKADEWYTTAISTVANASLMSGDSSGNFRPNDPITRGEFASIASRLAGNDVTPSGSFSDVSGHWAKDAIELAAGAGWIQGSNGQFRPNAYITRAEAATIVNAMVERKPHKDHLLESMTAWPDNPSTEWYYAAIQEATNTHDFHFGAEGEEASAATADYESWTSLGQPRDWSALMTQWSQAAAQPQQAAEAPAGGQLPDAAAGDQQ